MLLASDFGRTGARAAFPCMDEPDIRTRCAIIVTFSKMKKKKPRHDFVHLRRYAFELDFGDYFDSDIVAVFNREMEEYSVCTHNEFSIPNY